MPPVAFNTVFVTKTFRGRYMRRPDVNLFRSMTIVALAFHSKATLIGVFHNVVILVLSQTKLH